MSALHKLIVVCLTAIALTVAFSSTASAAAGDLDLVSWPDEPPLSSKSYSQAMDASISDNGRYVAYTTDYSVGCCSQSRDIVVRDMVTGDVQVASRASGEDGDIGDGDSNHAKISGNGRYVVFESWSSNLLGPSVDVDYYGVYRRDLQTGVTALVKGDYNGVTHPDISDDGRFVAYELWDYQNDIATYYVDMQEGVPHAVSRTDGDGPIESWYYAGLPSISGDGSAIAFASPMVLDLPGHAGTYVRNLAAHTTKLVSLEDGAAGQPLRAPAVRAPSLSTNGRIVAFGAYPTTPEYPEPGQTWEYSKIYTRNLDTNSTAIVSRPSGADSTPYPHGGMNASISGNGRYVAFDVDERDLRTIPAGGYHRAVMVRDTVLNTTTEVSLNNSPEALLPDGASDSAAISSDGAYVAFRSFAETLSDDDSYNGDVFRADVLGGSSDSITGPTPPGPKKADTYQPPIDEPITPPVQQQPLPQGSSRAPALYLAGTSKLKLARSLYVKVVCTPSPCTVATQSQPLKINGSNAGQLKFAGAQALNLTFSRMHFTLTKKQFSRAQKALKKGHPVRAEFKFTLKANGLTITSPITIKLKS